MDKYNNPSGNINNSNDNPWEYQANEVENTQEIPVVNDESPRGNGDNNMHMHSAPEHIPSTYAPETKQESHLGRNLSIVGAVAVAAVAGAVVMFNGNQVNAVSPVEASTQNIAAQESTQEDNITTSTEPDSQKIQNYKDSKPYEDGLTVQEFANSCGFDNLSEVCDYYSDDSASRLQYEMSQMGYHANGYELMMDQKGELLITVSSSFAPDNSSTLISLGVEAYIYKDLYHIRIYNMPNDGVSVEYDTDTIPTPEEAARILADNS